jgi:hypothetical protein
MMTIEHVGTKHGCHSRLHVPRWFLQLYSFRCKVFGDQFNISTYCRCLLIGKWTVSSLWCSTRCPTLRTNQVLTVTLLRDTATLCTARHRQEWRHSYTHATRSFTPEATANGINCIGNGANLKRFRDAISYPDMDQNHDA